MSLDSSLLLHACSLLLSKSQLVSFRANPQVAESIFRYGGGAEREARPGWVEMACKYISIHRNPHLNPYHNPHHNLVVGFPERLLAIAAGSESSDAICVCNLKRQGAILY